MFQSLIRFINNAKISRKLIIVYLTAAFPSMAVLGVYLVNNTWQTIIQQRSMQVVAENKRICDVLFDINSHCANISDALTFDEQLRGIISAQYENTDDTYRAYRNFKLIDTFTTNYTYTEISSIQIYVTNKTMVTSGNFVVADKNMQNQSWYKKAALSNGTAFWYCSTDINNYNYLHLVRRISSDDPNQYAVLVINVSNDYLKLMIGSTSINSLINIDGKDVFYSDNQDDLMKKFCISQHDTDYWNNDAYISNYRGTRVLMFDKWLKAINGSNSFQIITIDKDALSSAIKASIIILLTVLISLTSPIVLILLFSKSFSSRVITLRKEMHKIADGDFNIIHTFSGNDELGGLFNDMKRTIDSIKNLNEQLYQEKIDQQRLITQQRKMEFNMLANQINPHFFFNTLETINMKAVSHHEDEIAYITVLLGKIMRRALETHDKPVTLRTELDYVQKYLEIQHYRFGDRIRYEIEIDDNISIDDYHILPLLLQPIIENAMIHGLCETKTGLINVHLRMTELFLIISVKDNGIGMTEEKKAELEYYINNPEIQKSQGSIGLCNVANRIKLYYGQKYGIEIESMLRRGATITLFLPSDNNTYLS